MSAPRAWAELSAHGPTSWSVAAHGCMDVIDQPAVGLLTRFDLLVPTIDPVTLPWLLMTKPCSFWPNSSGAATLSGCSRHSSRPSERHDRLIGVGYSNGANILANLLFQNPSLVPAAVLMHPLIPFAPGDQPGLAGRRVLITAGEQDPICPPAMPRALHGYFERQRAAAEVVFHSGGHELQETELDAAQRFIATRPCFARRAAHPAGVRRLKSS